MTPAMLRPVPRMSNATKVWDAHATCRRAIVLVKELGGGKVVCWVNG